jgi:hypothetical protein
MPVMISDQTHQPRGDDNQSETAQWMCLHGCLQIAV